jgi:hypothetical protein
MTPTPRFGNGAAVGQRPASSDKKRKTAYGVSGAGVITAGVGYGAAQYGGKRIAGAKGADEQRLSHLNDRRDMKSTTANVAEQNAKASMRRAGRSSQARSDIENWKQGRGPETKLIPNPEQHPNVRGGKQWYNANRVNPGDVSRIADTMDYLANDQKHHLREQTSHQATADKIRNRELPDLEDRIKNFKPTAPAVEAKYGRVRSAGRKGMVIGGLAALGGLVAGERQRHTHGMR